MLVRNEEAQPEDEIADKISSTLIREYLTKQFKKSAAERSFLLSPQTCALSAHKLPLHLFRGSQRSHPLC